MSVTESARLAEAVCRYAQQLHAAVGHGHHVASPLGAWLVLALAGPASQGGERARLTEALGLPVDEAATWAAGLLSQPHQLVAAAAAVWDRPQAATPALTTWLRALPGVVEHGPIPAQDQAGEWARRHTFGLIDRFPLDLGPDTLLVLASALATRVSWEVPFDLVPAKRLGSGGPWVDRLSRVLATLADPRHRQYIAKTAEAGDVAVHIARARGGLQVTSVIAAPEVPSGDVLMAAHRLAVAATDTDRPDGRSLFDLPLGDGPAWTVSEQPAQTESPDGRGERFTAVLPAWAARSDHDLKVAPGFSAAAEALMRLLHGATGDPWEARQSAMARYSRIGFEAAAVSALAVFLSARMRRDGVVRSAELRFAHPYAVVACTADSRAEPGAAKPFRGWHGLPVFSAWITEPDDASDR